MRRKKEQLQTTHGGKVERGYVRFKAKGEDQPLQVRFVQEIDCGICKAWVECYDYLIQGDVEDPVAIYCTRHESKPLKLRGFLKSKGLEVKE